MKQGRIETITTRIISTTFMVVALAVFKPFGLDAWQWQAYIHLVVLGVIGFSVCMMTDIILKYVVKMPRSYKKGVEYPTPYQSLPRITPRLAQQHVADKDCHQRHIMRALLFTISLMRT